MLLATLAPRNVILKARPCLLGRWFTSSMPRYKQHLVILGSGWGGYNILRSVDKKRWGESEAWSSVNFFLNWTQPLADVTILSPNTYFNFTPLLASTAVGTLEFRCAVEPVSSSVLNKCPISNLH